MSAEHDKSKVFLMLSPRKSLVAIVTLVAAGAFLSLSGCWFVVGAASAGAGVAYVMGDLEGTLDGDVVTVAAATERALEDQKLHLISSDVTELDAKLVARTARDERVTIRLEAEPSARTQISIRVGLVGDEEVSQRIYDAIGDRLP
jgi:hypothetical protein